MRMNFKHSVWVLASIAGSWEWFTDDPARAETLS